MQIYTGVADANGDFNISFGSDSYTSGEKITVTAEKDSALKSIDLYAPSAVAGLGAIEFSGNFLNFPENIGVVTVGDVGSTIRNNAFTCAPTALSNYFIFLQAKGLVLSAPLQTIDSGAFARWINAESLVLPSTLQSIGGAAFQNWSALKTLLIPNSVSSLGSGAFSGASSLLDLVVSNSVLSIPATCFGGLTACKKVEILGQVTSIANGSFSNLSSCDEFILHAISPPTLNSTALSGLKSTCIIKVPAASVAAYQAASGWSAFASRIQAI